MSYKLIKKIPAAHSDGIWALSWSSKTNKLLTGSVDETVKVWNADPAANFSLSHTNQGHQLGVVSLDVNKAGTLAVSTSLDSQMRIWDLNNQTLVKAIDSGPVEAWSCAFSPDGRHIATGSHSGKVHIYSVETCERVSELDTKGKFVMSLCYVSALKF